MGDTMMMKMFTFVALLASVAYSASDKGPKRQYKSANDLTLERVARNKARAKAREEKHYIRATMHNSNTLCNGSWFPGCFTDAEKAAFVRSGVNEDGRRTEQRKMPGKLQIPAGFLGHVPESSDSDEEM